MKTITREEIETAFVAAGTPTLADVLDFVVKHPDLSPTRSRDLASGVRRLARIIDQPPEQIPADPKWLRPARGEGRSRRPCSQPETLGEHRQRRESRPGAVRDRRRQAVAPRSLEW